MVEGAGIAESLGATCRYTNCPWLDQEDIDTLDVTPKSTIKSRRLCHPRYAYDGSCHTVCSLYHMLQCSQRTLWRAQSPDFLLEVQMNKHMVDPQCRHQHMTSLRCVKTFGESMPEKWYIWNISNDVTQVLWKWYGNTKGINVFS